MINKFSMLVYNHSPVWMQDLFCTWAGKRNAKLRYGGQYNRWARFYADSAKWSEGELKEYQREQLAELIRDCFETIPHYRDTWRKLGLAPADVKDVEDLAKFPATTKEGLFAARDRALSTKVNRRSLVEETTGGSTGMPLPRYGTPEELRQHYAIFWDRMRPGVKLGDPFAAFQGKEIVPQSQEGPPYWRENRHGNQRLYSMRHLSPEKLQAYAESLDDRPFVYYQGYVSIMSVVAAYMAENGLRPRVPPKAVFSTSEQLTKAARRLFEETWQTKVWDEYCQCEKCALIAECEHGNHHAQMDYGIIEYESIGREGEYNLAEIICTGFIPRAAPLIRYRVGDRVLLDEKATCPCGRPGPVIKAIRGRIGDYIVTPDGRKYPHISLIVDLLRNVRRTQVVQDRPEEIVVRIVPFPGYTEEDEKHLRRCFQERIQGNIGVKVEYVSELERLPNGKILSIINRIPGHAGAADSDEYAD